MKARVIHGDCLDVMRKLAGEGVLVDSVVTDPPAGISFMGLAWDGDKGGRAQWVAWMAEVAAAALALAKPGAHALVWALPRTSHWTATAWEDAGWEVRDRVSHLFGTGFPKSLNVSIAIDKLSGASGDRGHGFNVAGNSAPSNGGSALRSDHPEYEPYLSATDAARQWQGWGTALKPAVEDWWLLRKPLIGTVAANILAHGTGALNIDGCRVGTEGGSTIPSGMDRLNAANAAQGYRPGSYQQGAPSAPPPAGRWPANVCHDGSDEVLEAFARFGERASGSGNKNTGNRGHSVFSGAQLGAGNGNGIGGDTGTAARFFYAAKASKADRAGSLHPTVKPVSLMRWLCRLITPPGGVILDPFAGSGSTGAAALAEGFRALLIEREAEYVADIHRRLNLPLFTEAAA